VGSVLIIFFRPYRCSLFSGFHLYHCYIYCACHAVGAGQLVLLRGQTDRRTTPQSDHCRHERSTDRELLLQLRPIPGRQRHEHDDDDDDNPNPNLLTIASTCAYM